MASNFEKLMEPMKDIDFQSMGQEEDNGEGDEAAASSVDIQVKKYDDPEKLISEASTTTPFNVQALYEKVVALFKEELLNDEECYDFVHMLNFRLSLQSPSVRSLFRPHPINPQLLTIIPELRDEFKKELDETTIGSIELLNYLRLNEKGNKKELPVKKEEIKVDKLRIVSWDLGGLTVRYNAARVFALEELIKREMFDIILLQEVNVFFARYLKCKLAGLYKFSAGRNFEDDHFYEGTFTLIRTATVSLVGSNIVYFERTGELRSLLKTEVKIGHTKLCILNTHLESMIHNSRVRVQQLQKCFKIFQAREGDANVIFSGSLNVRDWENVQDYDVWVAFGRDKNSECTWDLRVNKLIQFPDLNPDKITHFRPSHAQPFKRFDRIYFRESKKNFKVTPRSFQLIGKEIVAGGKYCISDHYGIVCDFNIDPETYTGQVRNDSEIGPVVSAKADLWDGEDLEETGAEKVKDSWDDDD
ncbi:tyrosyl-DNA phosphodiesterase 2 isoform X2 [Folsomia candida]|uniref:tyrosyl-DNA phosphodiesterase 2 isoform X2 n=1 Tax=Folsomia candida TaxID=158441 RepID=UPI000B8F3869|nr:tyrosyl-DNA phosphodiesterase 2 isoform X2 [Folsomia candida]